MNNNSVFKKLRVALGGPLGMSDDQLKKIFEIGGKSPSQKEFDGWKSGESNSRYRHMTDHDLECFLDGLIGHLRND